MAFLNHIEADRRNSPRTRNARLAAIRSFFRYAALRHPQHAAVIQRVLAIPQKRFDRAIVSFLSLTELDALVAAPDRSSWEGRRDYALLVVASWVVTAGSEFLAWADEGRGSNFYSPRRPSQPFSEAAAAPRDLVVGHRHLQSGLVDTARLFVLQAAANHDDRPLVTGDDSTAVLLALAAAATCLLSRPAEGVDLETRTARYRAILKTRGYVLATGTLKYSRLRADFCAAYPDELLNLLSCPLAGYKDWLGRLARVQDPLHPVHHLVLLHLLETSVEQFLDPSNSPFLPEATPAPFGEPPYPCLSPAADHHGESTIPTCLDAVGAERVLRRPGGAGLAPRLSRRRCPSRTTTDGYGDLGTGRYRGWRNVQVARQLLVLRFLLDF